MTNIRRVKIEADYDRQAAEIVDLYAQDSKSKETLTSVISAALYKAYNRGDVDGHDEAVMDDH